MRPVPGLCDRCGLRYNLSDLKEEFLMGKRTGVYACFTCYDESHPQLDTRGVRTDDKQSVTDPATDKGELADSRRLFGFYPYVGSQATSTITLSLGRVTVTTT